MSALPTAAVVGVVGAGTMGAGIAEVAAAAGHRVRIHDADSNVVDRALSDMRHRHAGRVDRGRMTTVEAEEVAARIQPAADLSELAPASLVVEAIVEDLEAKKQLLSALEDLVAPEAILASNTSSLSITALAAGLRGPGRVVGMHFFNPAPVLPLVEIVSGQLTEDTVAETAAATVAAWGKTPVHCASTPAFIVNRVARPFYGEAWNLVGEGASVEAVDALLRHGGGFAMGPFELMDLVGHDVNLAVSRSVFRAFNGDPRFAPSPAQADLVAAGRLGRKAGVGVYDWEAGDDRRPSTVDPGPPPEQMVVRGDLGPAAVLADLAGAAGAEVRRSDGDGTFEIDGVPMALTDGRPLSSRPAVAGLIDLAGDYGEATLWGVAGASEAVRAVSGLARALDKDVVQLDDHPGLIVMRTVCLLVAFAADAVHQQVARAEDVDTAMRLGVNYPLGPLEWGRRIGYARVVSVLDHLEHQYGTTRYRPGPLLRSWAARLPEQT